MPDELAMIEFACEGCGHGYKVKQELAGKQVRCKCGHVMTVPAAASNRPALKPLASPAPAPVAVPTVHKTVSPPKPPAPVEEELAAIDVDGDPFADDDDNREKTEIRATAKWAGATRHEDKWNRKPNVTGQGAIHVKTFSSKTNEQSLEFLDQKINEWLDAHPEYEVKFATVAPGEIIGKTREPGIFVSVWV